ncbi:aldo/keto reductase [Flavitalea flava]
MQYELLGRSGIRVSKIAFGCMSLKEGLVGEEDASRLIHHAIDKGIDFFDTADLYEKGMNENRLGKSLLGKRENVVLATKVGNHWRGDGSGWDWDPRKEYIISAVEESLKRLRTDYIDLYQLHGGTTDDPIDEIIETFELLQAQGKIRAYGLSSIRPQVIREYALRSRIVSVMLQYSLLDRRPEETCLGLLQEKRIGVLARGGLAQGLLLEKSPTPYLKYGAEEVALAAAAIRSHSGKTRSYAQTALQFILKNPAITSVVAGVRTMEQLEELEGTFNTNWMGEKEWQELSRIIEPNVYDQYR